MRVNCSISREERVMNELPGLPLLLGLLSDEVLTLPDWRAELVAGDND